jgi:prepilin-type processing-associated H-X9-DG protein
MLLWLRFRIIACREDFCREGETPSNPNAETARLSISKAQDMAAGIFHTAEECFMGRFAIDRHRGGINVGFVDGHSAKVKVKGLWTLDWASGFRTQLQRETAIMGALVPKNSIEKRPKRGVTLKLRRQPLSLPLLEEPAQLIEDNLFALACTPCRSKSESGDGRKPMPTKGQLRFRASDRRWDWIHSSSKTR